MAAKYPLGAGHRGSEVMSAQYLDPLYLTEGGARSSHNVFHDRASGAGNSGCNHVLHHGGVGDAVAASDEARAREFENPWMSIHAGAVGAALIVVLIGGLFVDFSKCEVQIWMFALLAAIAQKQMYVARSVAREPINAAVRPQPQLGVMRRPPTR